MEADNGVRNHGVGAQEAVSSQNSGTTTLVLYEKTKHFTVYLSLQPHWELFY